MDSMNCHPFLFSIALFGAGCGLANGQQPAEPHSGEIEALSVPKKGGPRIATPEQEAEIRKLIEDFVISEKEQRMEAAEQARSEKARADAKKTGDANYDPFASDTPPEVFKELRGYSQTRENAYKRLTEFKELAFPILAAHLDDKRPSLKIWNHIIVKTVGQVSYRVIHNQLMDTPDDYSEYGLQRIGRDGKLHEKPYWNDNCYDESDDLGEWLLRNQGLSYIEMRVKCLNWLLAEEKKIGVIDPNGYYVNILPLERAILELKAEAGEDVARELARVRNLSKTTPGNKVPKELMPDGPLREIEKKHSLQETSAMLKACPDGHTNLKDIPILYGTFPLLTKKPAEWNDEDKAIAKRRDAKEIILGGEPDRADDPRFQSTCLTCGYQYKMLAAPDLGANWVKDGHKFSDFTTAFSPVTSSLPFAKLPDADITVKVGKQGRVISESIEVTVPADKKSEWVAKIEKWIDENHFQRSLLHIENPPYPRLDEQELEDGNARFYIEIHTASGGNNTRIAFLLERTDS